MSLGWHVERSGAPRVWRWTRGAGATVAVLDDGLDPHHPEFEGRVVSPFNVRSGGSDVRGEGFQAHGTKVAGVIGAGGDEVTGVAPGATLLPVRLPSVREGTGSHEEALAIRHAVERGADVLCCAWGVTRVEESVPPLVDSTRDALRHAVTRGRNGKGCVVVFAAGNAGAPIHLNPYAANPDVVAVGACNDEDRRPAYSNFGAELWCVFPSSDPTDPEGRHRDIATTTPTGSFSLGETWYTDSFGLTSAACAGVAGVCALILSANPRLSGHRVREILRDSCTKVSPADARYDRSGHSHRYGYGRVDAFEAVRLARATT